MRFSLLAALANFCFIICGFQLEASAQIKKPVAFEVRSQLYIDGKLVASPKVATLSGSSAGISQTDSDAGETLVFEVTPSALTGKGVDNSVLLKFNVEYEKAGRKIKAAPQVAMIEGHHATISLVEGQTEASVKASSRGIAEAPVAELRVITVRK